MQRHGESVATDAPDLTVLRRALETEEHRFSRCKGNTTGDPDLVDLVAKADWVVPEARVGLTKPELRPFFLRGLTPGSWLVEEPCEGQRFSLLLMPFTMVSTSGLAHLSLMVPSCIQIHAGVRLVGFCSVTADLQLRTGRMEQSRLTMLLCQWLSSSFRSRGLLDPSISTPTASMCAPARARSHSARSAVRTSHFATDCNKLCRDTRELWGFHGAEPTSPRTISTSSIRHRRSLWAMPWGMHSPRKEQAFFLRPTTGSKWTRSYGLSNSASMPPVYLLLRLLHEVSLPTLRMSCSQHDASENVNAPSWKMLPRTHLSRLAKGTTAVCVRAPHQLVVRWIGCAAPFAQNRPALIRPIQCASGTRRYMSGIV